MWRAAAKSVLGVADRIDRWLHRSSDGRPPAQAPSTHVNDTVREVLIWSMDRLGDLVRATPAIEALKAHYAAARLTVVAAGRAGSILVENPHIDRVLIVASPYRLRDHRRILRQLSHSAWDLGVLMEADPDWTKVGGWCFRRLGVRRWTCFDFGRGVPRGGSGVLLGTSGSWIDQFNRLVEAAGAADATKRTSVYVSAAERQWAAKFLAGEGVDPTGRYFVVHPGGNFLTVSRQWPAESFADLIRLMRRRWPYPIILTGVRSEQTVVDQIQRQSDVPLVNLCGRLELRQLAAVLDRCTVCVTNDTGPLHVANGLGRRTVVIVGPTDPQVLGLPPTCIVARVDLPCSPCAALTGWQRCTNPHRWECLDKVRAELVMSRIEQQVGESD